MKVENFIKTNQYSYSSKDKWKYIYYLDTGNITENRIDEIVKLNPLTDKIPSRAKRKVKKGNIIYSTVRPNQKHYGYIDKEYDNLLISTGFVVIDVDENVADGKYFYYWLTQEKNTNYLQTIAENTVATYPSIAPKDIENMSIELPSLDIQRKIAKILSNYDDLIENNNKRIRILEEMAQKIYKEWFVDFKYSGYETATFTEIELGKLVMPKKGKNITKAKISEGNVPVVAGGLEPAYYHNIANTLSPVITISASGANAGYVKLYYEDIWASDCSYIDSNITPYVYYVYSYLKYNQIKVTNLQKGAAQPHVYPQDLAKLKIFDIDKKIIEQFNSMVTPAFEEIKNITLRNNILKQARDLLLPRLMSGEINIENMEIA